MEDKVDKIIIGAGIYGLYAAYFSAKKGQKIIVLEHDNKALSRGSYVNQARVHNGYHYPRSYSTAIKSSKYFNKFNHEFKFAINDEFEKIYGISEKYSWTSASQFQKFCNNTGIECEEINPYKYFKKGSVGGAFITQEYTFDAKKIRDYYVDKLHEYQKVSIIYNSKIKTIQIENNNYKITLENGSSFVSDYVLNATYASVNQILKKMKLETFKIKYEMCEVIMCKTSDQIRNVGITVMDGPFFSIMPFGFSGLHSLTSVTFTPHKTSYDELPTFQCQKYTNCSPNQLENCNECLHKPATSWKYMQTLLKKYLKSEIDITYDSSLFAIKPILMASEIDDSRPTVIKCFSKNPIFISVLSGKFNTIYDLDEVL